MPIIAPPLSKRGPPLLPVGRQGQGRKFQARLYKRCLLRSAALAAPPRDRRPALRALPNYSAGLTAAAVTDGGGGNNSVLHDGSCQPQPA